MTFNNARKYFNWASHTVHVGGGGGGWWVVVGGVVTTSRVVYGTLIIWILPFGLL